MAAIKGLVTDESGAVVPGAKVSLSGAKGFLKSTTSTMDGAYSVAGLVPGDYRLEAAAPDLALPQPAQLALKPGVLVFNIRLKVTTTVQQITVQENTGPAVTADPTNNASALVLHGEDLQALSDDPDDLASDLQALGRAGRGT